uniref:Uncharacterized protein n=1 Tax=Tetradesmus obliquus TaxID=3088 RepID=A0A383VRH4_TETOB|eukprot:jgi/Sobl393_1/6130/SZX67513.1
MAYLANYFKRQDLSDIDIVFRLNQVEQQVQPGISEDDASPPMKRGRRETVDEAVDAADKHSLQLSRFPGHKIVLFSVEYFKAQGRHWQAQRTAADTCKHGRASGSSAAAARDSVHLTINSAEQLPAAEAVIAAMYGVLDALSRLQPEQLVHAVVIADMLGAGD